MRQIFFKVIYNCTALMYTIKNLVYAASVKQFILIYIFIINNMHVCVVLIILVMVRCTGQPDYRILLY